MKVLYGSSGRPAPAAGPRTHNSKFCSVRRKKEGRSLRRLTSPNTEASLSSYPQLCPCWVGAGWCSRPLALDLGSWFEEVLRRAVCLERGQSHLEHTNLAHEPVRTQQASAPPRTLLLVEPSALQLRCARLFTTPRSIRAPPPTPLRRPIMLPSPLPPPL